MSSLKHIMLRFQVHCYSGQHVDKRCPYHFHKRSQKTQSQIEFSHSMYPQNIKAIFPFLGAFVKLFTLTTDQCFCCFGEQAFWYVFHPMHCYMAWLLLVIGFVLSITLTCDNIHMSREWYKNRGRAQNSLYFLQYSLSLARHGILDSLAFSGSILLLAAL